MVLFVCGFLGYQTPAFRRFSESGRFNRDTPIEVILGAVFGAVNGYWMRVQPGISSTRQAYPFAWIIAPDAGTEYGQQAIELLNNMVPKPLTGNGLYVAVAIAVLIVIGVMI